MYSAYNERTRENTVIRCPRGVTDKDRLKKEIENISLREFAERICHQWNTNKNLAADVIDPHCARKCKTRDVNSRHWLLSYQTKRQHIRPSITLFTRPAIEYEPIDVEECTSQTAFYDMPRDKCQQLLRAFQESVFYVPWMDSPDVTFLTEDQRNALTDDVEFDSRYSVRRLQVFFKVYVAKWREALGPDAHEHVDAQTKVRNQQWFEDNQYSFTMFLANQQNSHLRLDRMGNKGVSSATFDDDDELRGTELNVRPTLCDDDEDAEYPNVLNFCLSDNGTSEILRQPAPQLCEISVAFPVNHAWQALARYGL